MLTANNAAFKFWLYCKSYSFITEFFSSYHTAGYMHGTKFKQLFHARSQIAIAHSVEVIEGEKVKVLSKVTGQDVKLVQHSKYTDTHGDSFNPTFEIMCFKQKDTKKAEILLFGKAAGLKEILHVTQLCPQNLNKIILSHYRVWFTQKKNITFFSNGLCSQEFPELTLTASRPLTFLYSPLLMSLRLNSGSPAILLSRSRAKLLT